MKKHDRLEQHHEKATLAVQDLDVTKLQWQPATWEHALPDLPDHTIYWTDEQLKILAGTPYVERQGMQQWELAMATSEIDFKFNDTVYTLRAKRAEHFFTPGTHDRRVQRGHIELDVTTGRVDVLKMHMRFESNKLDQIYLYKLNKSQKYTGVGMAVYDTVVPKFAQNLANRNHARVTHHLTHGRNPDLPATMEHKKWVKVFAPFIRKYGYRSSYTILDTYIKDYDPE